MIPALEAAGASIVELGIPFSDPIADGPVIAASMHEALEAGVTPAGIFDMVRRLRAGTRLGLVAMVSASIVERTGPPRFLSQAAEAGFDGIIVPDVDLAAAAALREHADREGLDLTLLVAPTTPPPRIPRIVALCSGFVYLLARVGITGEQEAIPQIADRVGAVRRETRLPVAVGFGISSPEQVAAVTAAADAAVVGSALVRRLGEAPDPVVATAQCAAALAAALARRPQLRPEAPAV